MSDALRKQGNALENQFFQQVDHRLLEQIRKNLDSVSKRDALAQVANVQDPQVLDHMMALNIDAATFAAMTFVPVAAVAWADGTLDASERRAILQAAEQHGIHAGRPGYQLLEQWLNQTPSADVFTAWKSYVAALKREADPQLFASLKSEVLGLAEKIAHASGGILGLALTVSPGEKAKLAELEQVFNA